MKKVNAQALGDVNRALGLTGAGSPSTEFSDGILDQVVDVGPLIRRGNTLAQTQGVFTGVLVNDHTGAGTLSTTADVYELGNALVTAPYPPTIPRGLELWLIGASCQQVTGSGTFSGALYLNVDDVLEGFHINNSGTSPGTVSSPMAIAYWDAIKTVTNSFGIQEDGKPFAPIGLRLPRTNAPGTTVIWRSTASAVTRFECLLLMGLFPIGMGQDILAK